VLVDPLAPTRGQLGPILPFGHAVLGEFGQLLADLVECHSEPLGEDDERDPPQHLTPVAAVPGARPFGPDEATSLVETQRRRADAAAE